MRNLKFIILFITSLSVYAQAPIIDIATDPMPELSDGAYIKDTQNILDKYIGTWIWTDGTDTFEIHIQKRIMIESVFNYYHDGLTGRYKYTVNGVIIEDNLNIPFISYPAEPINSSYSENNVQTIRISSLDNGMRGRGFITIDTSVSPYTLSWDVRGRGHRQVYVDPNEEANRPTEYNFPTVELEETPLILIKQ